MNPLKKWRVALVIVLCAVIGVMANAYPGMSPFAAEDTTKARTEAQDVRGLDRRISLLEQRLFSIESSLNRLQQSEFSQRTTVPQSSARDQEISLLTGAIQTFQLRLSEIECGLVKLDERTSTAAVREARKSPGASTADPCRLNPATPLRLSTRP